MSWKIFLNAKARRKTARAPRLAFSLPGAWGAFDKIQREGAKAQSFRQEHLFSPSCLPWRCLGAFAPLRWVFPNLAPRHCSA